MLLYNSIKYRFCTTYFTQFITSFYQNNKIIECSKNNTRNKTSVAVDLSYKIIGDDPGDYDLPPLFILHGLLGFKKHWQGLGKTLMKVTKRCVILVDLRNHGWSPHVKPHKYEDMALDLLKLYNKLKIDKATLIGHSMGGRTAMVLSLMEPLKVDNIIIIDISPISSTRQWTEFFPQLMAAMKEINFKDLETVNKARDAAKKHLRPLVKDDVVLYAVLGNIMKKRNNQIGWICNLDLLISDFQYVAQFPEDMRGKVYSGPTLFIGGQYSDFIQPDDLTGIREYFPRAMVKYVPKAGHNVHADDPGNFLQLVISFLRTTEDNNYT